MLELGDIMVPILDPLGVISSGLAVPLRRVSHLSKILKTKEYTERLENFGHELRRVVGQEVNGDCVSHYPIIKEFGRDIRGSG